MCDILYEAGPCNAGKACFVIGFVQKDFLSLLVKKFSQYLVGFTIYLLLKLHCHANVEAINKLSTIAYALDYILKGSDRAKVIMHRIKNS